LNSVTSSLATYIEINQTALKKNRRRERERERGLGDDPKPQGLCSDGDGEDADVLDSVLRAARSFEIRLIAE
jgi:hypothetical protein